MQKYWATTKFKEPQVTVVAVGFDEDTEELIIKDRAGVLEIRERRLPSGPTLELAQYIVEYHAKRNNP